MTIRSFQTYPNQKRSSPISFGEGPFIHLSDGRRLLDLTAGVTGYAILGAGNKKIISAIHEQLNKYSHADYKYFEEPLREKVASRLLAGSPGGLDRVLFAGGSGSEACEMALQLSYQIHRESGHGTKTWAIGTRQSYHGSTTGALSVGERPNLEFYNPILPQNRLRIPECNYVRNSNVDESPEAYASRAASYLESAILSIGSDRVACFLGETMLGGLVGDVPASPTYWKKIRDICNKYDVHLILDEVWCGGGVSGKFHCFEWDEVSPDMVIAGKTLAAGYLPLSVLYTKSEFEEIISNGSGRLETSCTFQGHSVSCAAALAVQDYIIENDLINRGDRLGLMIRDKLTAELGDHEFTRDIRGRGIRNTIEYACDSPHLFGQQVADHLNTASNIFISGKWHRLSLTHSLAIDEAILLDALDRIVSSFRKVASHWTSEYVAALKLRNVF